MAQVVTHLPSKREALSLDPNTAKNKKQEKRKHSHAHVILNSSALLERQCKNPTTLLINF
jgi:hypothetical protein